MRRELVVYVLRDLVPDVQKKIFKLIFPTRSEIHCLLQRQCVTPKSWAFTDEKFTNLAHSHKIRIKFPGIPVMHRRFVYNRCTLLKFTYQTGDQQVGHRKDVTVFKPAGWCFSDALQGLRLVPKRLKVPNCKKVSLQENATECELCGQQHTAPYAYKTRNGLCESICWDCAALMHWQTW